MKTLVVGSTSVIGRAIAARARDQGVVKLAGRRDADYAIDLSRAEPPDIPESFDVVVHAAADFGGDEDQDFIRAELVNAVGTLSVCAVARQVGARQLVLVSSVFAGYQPGDPFFGIYPLSKRHGEEAAQLFCSRHDIALAVLRPSQVYGDTDAGRRHQGLLYAMADRAQRGEDICIHGSHDARRNYIHLDDVAEACSRVIAQGCSGVFTCAHPDDVRLSEVARAALDAFGMGGGIRFDPGRADLPDLPPVGAQPLYERIGYRPAIDIREGFERIRRFRGSHR